MILRLLIDFMLKSNNIRVIVLINIKPIVINIILMKVFIKISKKCTKNIINKNRTIINKSKLPILYIS